MLKANNSQYKNGVEARALQACFIHINEFRHLREAVRRGKQALVKSVHLLFGRISQMFHIKAGSVDLSVCQLLFMRAHVRTTCGATLTAPRSFPSAVPRDSSEDALLVIHTASRWHIDSPGSSSCNPATRSLTVLIECKRYNFCSHSAEYCGVYKCQLSVGRKRVSFFSCILPKEQQRGKMMPFGQRVCVCFRTHLLSVLLSVRPVDVS